MGIELEVLMEVAGRLAVSVCGDFDDGAFGRYDEPVFCGWKAYFMNGPFTKTPYGKGKTPREAILNLLSGVKDWQRLLNIATKQCGKEDAERVISAIPVRS